jgi:hypothetical protein
MTISRVNVTPSAAGRLALLEPAFEVASRALEDPDPDRYYLRLVVDTLMFHLQSSAIEAGDGDAFGRSFRIAWDLGTRFVIPRLGEEDFVRRRRRDLEILAESLDDLDGAARSISMQRVRDLASEIESDDPMGFADALRDVLNTVEEHTAPGSTE